VEPIYRATAVAGEVVLIFHVLRKDRHKPSIADLLQHRRDVDLLQFDVTISRPGPVEGPVEVVGTKLRWATIVPAAGDQ